MHGVTVWINGTLVPDDEARVSIFDHGLVVGDGVFETVKVARGVPFVSAPHLVHRGEDADLWMAFFRDPDGGLLALMAERPHPAE